MAREKAVVLVSGGMDSAPLLWLARKRRLAPHALTVDYGQRNARREVAAARKLARSLGVPHRVVRARFLRELGKGSSPLLDPRVRFTRERVAYGSAYVPHRNLLLFSVACAYAESLGARKVWYGALCSDNDYWDADPAFFRRLNRALALRPKPVRIEVPFIRLEKDDVLRRGLGMGVRYELTSSCFVGGTRACGRCPACRKRLEAWRKVRAQDPLRYAG